MPPTHAKIHFFYQRPFYQKWDERVESEENDRKEEKISLPIINSIRFQVKGNLIADLVDLSFARFHFSFSFFIFFFHFSYFFSIFILFFSFVHFHLFNFDADQNWLPKNFQLVLELKIQESSAFRAGPSSHQSRIRAH